MSAYRPKFTYRPEYLYFFKMCVTVDASMVTIDTFVDELENVYNFGRTADLVTNS